MADFSVIFPVAGPTGGLYTRMYLWNPSGSSRTVLEVESGLSWAVFQATAAPTTPVVAIGTNHELGSLVAPVLEIRLDTVSEPAPTAYPQMSPNLRNYIINPGTGLMLIDGKGLLNLAWSEELN